MSKEELRTARARYLDNMANDLAKSISATLAASKPKSMGDAYIAIIAAVGKVIQTTSLITGSNPKEIGAFISSGIASYFKCGGDPRIEEILNNESKKETEECN